MPVPFLPVHDWHDHCPAYLKAAVARVGGFATGDTAEQAHPAQPPVQPTEPVPAPVHAEPSEQPEPPPLEQPQPVEQPTPAEPPAAAAAVESQRGPASERSAGASKAPVQLQSVDRAESLAAVASSAAMSEVSLETTPIDRDARCRDPVLRPPLKDPPVPNLTEPNVTQPNLTKPNITKPACGASAASTAVDGSFEDFWGVVHRKVGKGGARRAFEAATRRIAKRESCPPARARSWLIERMTEFARSPQARDEVKGQIHPATWLNDERYDDDPREWTGNARAGPEPVSEAYRKAEQIRQRTRNAGMKSRASEEKINQAIAKRLIEAGLGNQHLPRERDAAEALRH